MRDRQRHLALRDPSERRARRCQESLRAAPVPWAPRSSRPPHRGTRSSSFRKPPPASPDGMSNGPAAEVIRPARAARREHREHGTRDDQATPGVHAHAGRSHRRRVHLLRRSQRAFLRDEAGRARQVLPSSLAARLAHRGRGGGAARGSAPSLGAPPTQVPRASPRHGEGLRGGDRRERALRPVPVVHHRDRGGLGLCVLAAGMAERVDAVHLARVPTRAAKTVQAPRGVDGSELPRDAGLRRVGAALQAPGHREAGSLLEVAPGLFWASWAFPLFAWDVLLAGRRKP